MSDVIFIAVMIVFFLLCALYVHVCDRMIGPDELAIAGGQGADASPDGESAESTTSTPTKVGVKA